MSVEVPPGINPLNEDGTPKTAKQIEKEVKKKAKEDKYKEKMAKMAAASADKPAKQKKPAAPKEQVGLLSNQMKVTINGLGQSLDLWLLASLCCYLIIFCQ